MLEDAEAATGRDDMVEEALIVGQQQQKQRLQHQEQQLEGRRSDGVPTEITTNSSHRHDGNHEMGGLPPPPPPPLPEMSPCHRNNCTLLASSSQQQQQQRSTSTLPTIHDSSREMGIITTPTTTPLEEQAPPLSPQDLDHIRVQRERRKQRQMLQQRNSNEGGELLETMSRASTISWADNDHVCPIDSEQGRGRDYNHPAHFGTIADPTKNGKYEQEDESEVDSTTTRRTISERISQSVQEQMHHHYSVLFGDDYSKREASFVLLAGIVMAFNSGFVNVSCVSGFLTGGTKQVVAGFAGPFAHSSIAVASQQWQLFGFHSNIILSYMAGAGIAGLFTPQARPYSIQPTYGPTFLVGGIMLFMASILAALESDPKYIFFLTAGANGLQNGIASIYSSNLIRCSMTGAITDVALAMGQLARGNRKHFPKAVVLSLIVLFFWLGGICSYYMTKHFLSLTLFFNAALFWLVGFSLVVFLVKNVSISTSDAIFGTWQWKKTLRQMGGNEGVESMVRLKALFEVIDADGNGEIDFDELLTYLLQMDKRTTVRAVKMLMRSADRDKDGRISRAEWERMVSKLYV